MLVTLQAVHAESWTRQEHLLGDVVDALGVVSHHALVGPHADPKKLRSVKPPKRMDRPGVERKRKKRRASGVELRDLLLGATGARGSGTS